MKKSLSIITALGAATLAAGVNAETNALKLSSVVVSAAHMPQDASDIYNGVSVVTREDLDRTQATNVIEVLQTLPGVSITQSGGKGSLSGFFIRGTKSAQTLVLIDGVRASSAASGAAALETLSVDQIERIEVIRGARSSQYGADAIGGVIQIFTRRANQEGISSRVKIGYGSHDTWERSLGASFQNQSTTASVNFSSDESTGHDRSRSPLAANQDDDAFRNHALSINASHKLTQDLKLSLSHLHQKGETEYDYGWAGSFPFDEFEVENTAATLDWTVNSVWNTRLEVGNNQNDNINLYDDAASRSFFNTKRLQVQWSNLITLKQHQLQLGLDTYNDELTGSTAFAETERQNDAAFFQYRFSEEKISAEAGIRYDDNEVYGDFTSFNLGAGWRMDETTSFFLTYNEAFRAPSFSELYYPNYDNPNLTPEESKNIELKISKSLSDVTSISTSVYHTDIDQAIINNEFWIPHNIGQVEIEGAEIEYATTLKGMVIKANASYVDARDEQTGFALNRRPQKTANLDVSKQLGDWTLGTSIYGSGASWDDTASTRKIAGFALWNLRASYAVSKNVTAAVKIDNLLDKRYSTALTSDGVWPNNFYTGYNELGRTGFVSITWTPNL